METDLFCSWLHACPFPEANVSLTTEVMLSTECQAVLSASIACSHTRALGRELPAVGGVGAS
jgi:hypothetical protein